MNEMTMDDDDTRTSLGDLPDEQQITVVVLEMFSASLSIIGSSAIIWKILHELAHNRSRFLRPYDRIILALSGCDIVASITWSLNRFFQPTDMGTAWALGNEITCQVCAFLTQLAVSAWWYNCLLSYYFLLTVLSQARRKNFVQKNELWMHLSGLFFPITAIVGLFRGWYAQRDLGTSCYITDPTIKWIVAGIPILFILLSLIVNNIAIYAIVRMSLQFTSEHAVGLTPLQKQLKRESTTLMFLYVACFFITVTPTFIREVLVTHSSNVDIAEIYPILIFEAIFLPLQGFFNFFIYIKPVYTRFRVANLNKSMHFVFHQALFNSKVPRLRLTSNQQPTSNQNESNQNESDDATNPNRVLFNSNFPSLCPSNDSFSARAPNINTDLDAKEEE